MSYSQKKAEIAAQAASSNRRTFNESAFNELGTALLNDPNAEVEIIKKAGGGITTETINPSKDLRDKLIGSVAKAAGLDVAEQKKLQENYQFPNLPLYPFVSETLEGYMDCGKSFKMMDKKDFSASISIKNVEKEVKDVKSPTTGEVKRKEYGAFRRAVTKSVCPVHLRTDVK